ncbi:MAG: enamine deaminase RidA (YjgF/YER057c/UK114 family) [Candidatus Poriferisodalaceae bacterium]|jgi:enamine deaminase RidA (YjgF/YER057c/UK114 family)
MGLARAVRVGNHVVVGGTAAIGLDGMNIAADDIAAQAERCYRIIWQALAVAGASPADVVRTRTMMTDVTDYAIAVEARKAFLGDTLAAETIVEVARFVHPDWKIEIEVDAIIKE